MGTAVAAVDLAPDRAPSRPATNKQGGATTRHSCHEPRSGVAFAMWQTELCRSPRCIRTFVLIAGIRDAAIYGGGNIGNASATLQVDKGQINAVIPARGFVVLQNIG